MGADAVPEPAAVVDAFLAAYNAGDLDAVGELLHDDVRVVHYGTPFDITGRDAVIESFARSRDVTWSQRAFLPRRRTTAQDDRVVLEHAWAGTAAVDVPDRAKAGEVVHIELCSVFTIRDGRIAAYDEWG
jgi:ketosteroid isomerase-like protein